MRVKSYYAASIDAAMATAAKEMGTDAVLITSRRSGIDAQHLGAYEVVFGTMEEPASEAQSGATPPALPSKKDAAPSDLDLLRGELAEMRRALTSACRSVNSRHWMPELTYADSILSEADIPAELREDILGAVDVRLRDEMLYDQGRTAAIGKRSRFRASESAYFGSEERILPLLREQFDTLLEVAPQIEPKEGSRPIVALAGPSGAGKTSTLVKLAIQQGLAARRSVLIISTDSYRAGATEQLRVYAAAIGVHFLLADSPLALSQAFQEHAGKQLILIDTPGAAPSDMDLAVDTARFLASHREVETHLVLPVTASAAALATAAKRFACYAPEKAILTKLDESVTWGAALGQAIISSLPLSFITTGQQVPDDLAAADKDSLLSFLAVTKTNRAVSAA